MKTLLLLCLTVSTYSQICTEETCNFNGQCNSNSECICDNGYITYNITDETYNLTDGTQCNYKQKNAVTAFWLEFLCLPVFSLGAGYYYVGSTDTGGGQLTLSFFGSLFLLLIYFSTKKNDKSTCLESLNSWCIETKTELRVSWCVIFLLPMVIWWAAASVAFLSCGVNDGYGAPLYC